MKTYILSLFLFISFITTSIGQTDDYPLKNSDCSKSDNLWGFWNRNCTSFAAWRMNQLKGYTDRTADDPFMNTSIDGVKTYLSDARFWADVMRSLGYSVDKNPQIGDIAQWTFAPDGHVAFVYEVNSDGTVNVEEYNYNSCVYGKRTNLRADNYIHYIKMLPIYGGSIVNPKQVTMHFELSGISTAFLISEVRIKGALLNPQPTINNFKKLDINKYSCDIQLTPQMIANIGLEDRKDNFITIKITNGEIVKKAFGKIYFLSPNSYTDVDKTSWYWQYVKIATEQGIFRGYFDKGKIVFGVNSKMKKRNVAKILVETALLLGDIHKDNKVFHLWTEATNGVYTDVPITDPDFVYIQTIKNYNYYPETKFNPDSYIDIGDFCRLLVNIFQLSADDKTIFYNNWVNKVIIKAYQAKYQESMDIVYNIFDVKQSLNGDGTTSDYYIENMFNVCESNSNLGYTGEYLANGTQYLFRTVAAKVVSNIYDYKLKKINQNKKKSASTAIENFTVIGNKLEFGEDITGDKPDYSFSRDYALLSGQTLDLGIDIDKDNDGNPIKFYWSCSGGQLKTISTNFNRTRFIAPQVNTPETIDVYYWIGFISGKTFEWKYKITINPYIIANNNTPGIQASNITFSNVTQNSMQINWTRGNGANCVVYGRENSASMTILPYNGEYYAAKPVFSDGNSTFNRVVYVGNSNSVTVTGLKPNTDYSFLVYEFNGTSIETKYLLQTPPAGYQKTSDVVKNSSITVTIMPESARNYGRWYISGGDGSLKTSGETVSNLPAGEYKIGLLDINTITGYSIGALPTFSLMENESKNVTANYSEGINPLQVDFTYSPTQVVAGVPVSFIGTHSHEFLWSFEGANISSYSNWSSIDNVIFANEGVYNVTYKITDVNIGRTNTITKKIEVLNSNVVYPELAPIIAPQFSSLALPNSNFMVFEYVKNLGATHYFGDQQIQWGIYLSDNNTYEAYDTELNYLWTGNTSISSNETRLIQDEWLWIPNTSLGNKYIVMKLNTMYPSINDPSHPDLWTDRDLSNNTIAIPITITNNWIGTPKVQFANGTATYINVEADLVVRNSNPRPNFRIELSDKNGNFTNPIKIDICWIDGNDLGITKRNDIYLPKVEFGSNYRIRLVCEEDGSISPSSVAFSINGTPTLSIKDLKDVYNAGEPNFVLNMNTSGLVNGVVSQGTFYVNGTQLTSSNTVSGNYELNFSQGTAYTVKFDYVQNNQTYSVTKNIQVNGSYSINIGNISNSFCAGSSLTLITNLQGVYLSDNLFIVELSDASGYFTNPITINTLNSNTLSDVNCYLPYSMQSGGNYKLRVRSTLPEVTSNTTNSFTINPANIPNISISSNNTTCCSGNELIFNSLPNNEGTSPTYEWLLNGQPQNVNSTTFSTSSLNDGDIVCLQMTSNINCAFNAIVNSNELNIAVNPIVTPSAEIYSYFSTIQKGQTVNINSFLSNCGDNPVYQWSINGVNIENNLPVLITDTLTGGSEIKLVVTSNAQCLTSNTAVSNTQLITISETTSIGNVISNMKVNIYPNPTSKLVHVDLSNIENNNISIKLYSLTGSVMQEWSNIKGKTTQILNLESISAGSYFLLVSTEKGNLSKILIIK